MSYWTSPSQVLSYNPPRSNSKGKIKKHLLSRSRGKRIAKINAESGEMTDYDISTWPLSTTVLVFLMLAFKTYYFTFEKVLNQFEWIQIRKFMNSYLYL
jgi:hypothetical protein